MSPCTANREAFGRYDGMATGDRTMAKPPLAGKGKPLPSEEARQLPCRHTQTLLQAKQKPIVENHRHLHK